MWLLSELQSLDSSIFKLCALVGAEVDGAPDQAVQEAESHVKKLQQARLDEVRAALLAVWEHSEQQCCRGVCVCVCVYVCVCVCVCLTASSAM